MVINYPVELAEIKGVQIAGQVPCYYSASAGKIYVAWASISPLQLLTDDLMLLIKVKVNTGEYIENQILFTIDSNSELADEDALVYQDVLLNIPQLIIGNVTGIESLNNEFSLVNYPNPFSQSTEFQYTLIEGSEITLIIYDVLGQQVQTLINEYQPSGTHSLRFSAQDLSAGIYYCKMEVQTDSRSQILTRQLFINR